MSAPETAPALPPRFMQFAVIGSALLALVAAGGFYWASQRAGQVSGSAEGYAVSIMSGGCVPDSLSVPAGERRFVITNQSDRAVEWEILDGVMVVAERENIVPGIVQTVSARLAPGDYAITCGLLSNPHGTLHVTPTASAATVDAALELREFLGPLSEYKVFLVLGGKGVVAAARQMADAIKAGDIETARRLYTPARQAYLALEPLAFRFSDLQTQIDPEATYLDKREHDPAFTGFHRLEYGLFDQNTLDGLTPIVDALVDRLAELNTRLHEVQLTPGLLADAAAAMANRLAQRWTDAAVSPYAHTDLADMAAGLAGIAKLAGLLTPVVAPTAPQLAAGVDAALSDTATALNRFQTAQGYAAPETLDAAARGGIASQFTGLADALGKLSATIGGI